MRTNQGTVPPTNEYAATDEQEQMLHLICSRGTTRSRHNVPFAHDGWDPPGESTTSCTGHYGASPKNDRIRASSTASCSMLWPCC